MQQSSWQDGFLPRSPSVPGALLPAYRAIVPAEATLPLDLVTDAVVAAGVQEARRRLLPAAAVVIFVLGCALMHDMRGSVSGGGPQAGWVARPAGRAGPAAGAVRRVAGPLAGPGTPGAFAFGRLLTALDGTMPDVPASPANWAAFGAPPSGSGGFGASLRSERSSWLPAAQRHCVRARCTAKWLNTNGTVASHKLSVRGLPGPAWRELAWPHLGSS